MISKDFINKNLKSSKMFKKRDSIKIITKILEKIIVYMTTI